MNKVDLIRVWKLYIINILFKKYFNNIVIITMVITFIYYLLLYRLSLQTLCPWEIELETLRITAVNNLTFWILL